MTDLVLNSLRVLLLAGVLLTFWRYRLRERAPERQTAWRMILGGVGLMLFGSVLDVSENIPSLSSIPALGGSGIRSWLENLVGYIGGCLLLFFGFRRWLALAGTEQRQSRQLMHAIARAQSAFISTTDAKQAFEGLLQDILELTGSEYGFIGEVLWHGDGQPYLKTHAITNIAWNEETLSFYAEHAPQGMEFTNLNSLFGAVLVSGAAVIANDPAHDPRRGGLPLGHPPLNAFLGLPIGIGERMLGMVGIANRAGGYDDRVIEFLRPLSGTLAQLIEARQAVLARQAIDASHRRLSLVASRTTNGVVITDSQGHVEWVNAGFERLTGYTLAEVRGRKPGQVLHGPGTDPATVARMSAALRRDESFEVETLNYTKDGRPYWVSLSVDPMRDEAGQLRGYMGIETDISTRKKAEAAGLAARTQIQAVLDHVLDGIITIDGRGIVASCNLSAERIFGYAAEAVIGHNINMLMPEPYRSRHDGYLRNYQTGGEAKVIGIGREVEGQRKDGSTFPMDLAVTEIESDGQPLYIGMVRDITERKRMERLKSEFLSTVSHELRTPLTSIRGALGLIAGGALGPLSEQVEQMVGIAHKNSEHLTHLINDLLDMEKMAASGMHFDLQPQSLMPLVEQAIEAIRAYGGERRVSFVLTERDEDATVRVDAKRFLQVMANLLSNAAKFSPDDGQVEVAVTRRDDQVRVAVSDLGPGVPANFRDRIFEKFSQADASDTRQKGGTGLGLAITRELVQRMAGRIGFDSREGEGAIFHVDLPLLPAAPRSERRSVAVAEIADAPRLLVVEDNRDVAGLLAIMLRRAGFNVDLAEDARTALARLAAHVYAAMTLDLNLPDISGVEIVRTLRASPATRDLPIVVLSAHLEAGQLALAGELNTVDWLAKPFDETHLLTAVRQAVRGDTAVRPRVLHVEDDADLRQVVSTLGRDIAEFVPARNLAEARTRLRQGRYSVVMLDLGLPDGSGWELMPALRALTPIPRVIILSGSETTASQADAVAAAMVKSRISDDELLQTLHRVIRQPAN